MIPDLSLDSRAIALADADATRALGARIGAALLAQDVVCLWGGLGAGKTTLARGAVGAWTGLDEDVPSPTYTLMQSYEGARGVLWHCDLYRLKHPDEAEEIGLLDALETGACLIEWPERLGGEGAWLPRARLDIALEPAGEARRATLTAHGAWRSRLGSL